MDLYLLHMQIALDVIELSIVVFPFYSIPLVYHLNNN